MWFVKLLLALLGGIGAVLVLPILGAIVGWLGGYYLIGMLVFGVPEDPDCGQGGLLVLFAGCVGAFLGAVAGGGFGLSLLEELAWWMDEEVPEGPSDESPTVSGDGSGG